MQHVWLWFSLQSNVNRLNSIMFTMILITPNLAFFYSIEQIFSQTVSARWTVEHYFTFAGSTPALVDDDHDRQPAVNLNTFKSASKPKLNSCCSKTENFSHCSMFLKPEIATYEKLHPLVDNLSICSSNQDKNRCMRGFFLNSCLRLIFAQKALWQHFRKWL